MYLLELRFPSEEITVLYPLIANFWIVYEKCDILTHTILCLREK